MPRHVWDDVCRYVVDELICSVSAVSRAFVIKAATLVTSFGIEKRGGRHGWDKMRFMLSQTEATKSSALSRMIHRFPAARYVILEAPIPALDELHLLTELRTLTLLWMPNVNAADLSRIFRSCTKLEKITLFHTAPVERRHTFAADHAIAGLSNLRELSISNAICEMDEELMVQIAEGCPQLEYVNIEISTPQAATNFAVTLANNCPKLANVTMRNIKDAAHAALLTHCPLITRAYFGGNTTPAVVPHIIRHAKMKQLHFCCARWLDGALLHSMVRANMEICKINIEFCDAVTDDSLRAIEAEFDANDIEWYVVRAGEAEHVYNHFLRDMEDEEEEDEEDDEEDDEKEEEEEDDEEAEEIT